MVMLHGLAWLIFLCSDHFMLSAPTEEQQQQQQKILFPHSSFFSPLAYKKNPTRFFVVFITCSLTLYFVSTSRTTTFEAAQRCHFEICFLWKNLTGQVSLWTDNIQRAVIMYRVQIGVCYCSFPLSTRSQFFNKPLRVCASREWWQTERTGSLCQYEISLIEGCIDREQIDK